MTTGAVSVLLIGAVLGDSDQERTWGRAIGRLSMKAEALSAGVDSPITVSVAYHVDGRAHAQ